MSIAGVSGVSATALTSATSTSSSSKSSSTKYYDPADANQDGVVSAAEDLAYSLKHPELDKTRPTETKKTSALDLLA